MREQEDRQTEKKEKKRKKKMVAAVIKKIQNCIKIYLISMQQHKETTVAWINATSTKNCPYSSKRKLTVFFSN